MPDQVSAERSVSPLQVERPALPVAWKARLAPLLIVLGIGSPLVLCLLAFLGVPLLLIVFDQILLIRYAFPILALVVGAYLFVRSPPHYVGLCLWLFFMTPFVRRFVDASEGWLQTNPVMLSPYLAASLTFFSAVAYALKMRSDVRSLLPYALMIGAVGYGFLVGLLNGYIVSGVFESLRWSVPVSLVLFLLQHRRLARDMRRVIIGCFLWALPVMGIYGLFQFVSPPAWDTYWMQDTPSGAYGSSLEALELRVFSTMNAPQVFATTTAAGLLLLVCVRSWWLLPCGAPALIALLLTLSRAVVGAWVASLVYLLVMGPKAVRVRTGVCLLIGILVVAAALIAFPPLQAQLSGRVEQSMDLTEDGSALSRSAQYAQFPSLLLGSPQGWGISWKGTYGHLDDKQVFTADSGIIETFLGFGVLGGLAYFTGLGICLVRLGKIALASEDAFVHACVAVALLATLQLPLQHQFIAPGGFIVWLFIGAGLTYRRRTSSETKLRNDHKRRRGRHPSDSGSRHDHGPDRGDRARRRSQPA